MERYAVYILASRRNGTLYIGVTSSLEHRIAQHKARTVPGFTQRYGVTTLVYVERYANVYDAIAHEKQLKGWNRAWKLKLIERGNPNWDDLDPTACRRVIPGRSEAEGRGIEDAVATMLEGSAWTGCLADYLPLPAARPGMTAGRDISGFLT